MKKLNISYTRQSFKRAETDSSVIWQKQLILEYAAKHGYNIDAHFDDIKSGNRTDRAGLQAVRRLINDDKVTSLTVYRIDRIYRNYRQALEFFQLCAEKKLFCTVLKMVRSTSVNQKSDLLYKCYQQRLRISVNNRFSSGR